MSSSHLTLNNILDQLVQFEHSFYQFCSLLFTLMIMLVDNHSDFIVPWIALYLHFPTCQEIFIIQGVLQKKMVLLKLQKIYYPGITFLYNIVRSDLKRMFILMVIMFFLLSLQLNYDKSYAGMFSTTFEIGGVLGSACNGIFINR